jgi:hypothetical protein
MNFRLFADDKPQSHHLTVDEATAAAAEWIYQTE